MPVPRLLLPLKRTLSAAILICGTLVATSALAESQGGNGPSGMMGGNGLGGIRLLILVVVVVAGIVAWMVAKNKK